LTSKYDLDLGDRGAGIVLDILSYDYDYLCQDISKSLKLWRLSRHKIYPITDYVSFTSKCVLDLGGRDAGVVFDTSSYYSDYLWQVFSKSFYH
jgi:hypothetical protein